MEHEDDTMRATAILPGLEIEIVHRRSPGGDAEQISINLQAVPSFARNCIPAHFSLPVQRRRRLLRQANQSTPQRVVFQPVTDLKYQSENRGHAER